jgi:uncharacterized membrane protein
MAGEVLIPEGECKVTDYCLVHVCYISKIIAYVKGNCVGMHVSYRLYATI